MEIVKPYAIPLPISDPIDRDMVVLPEVMCETFEWDRLRAMRPVLDALWQASGQDGSPSYTPDGESKPIA